MGITRAQLQKILGRAKDAADSKTASPTLMRGLQILMQQRPVKKPKTQRTSINTIKRLVETPRARWTPLQQQLAAMLDANPTEEWIHTQFIQWVKQSEATIPDLKYLYHPANGGLRNVLVAMLFKLLGVRRGTPDIHWPLPRGDYTALWIELKRVGEKPTAEQSEWHEWLRNNGAFVTVLTDWQTARDTVLWYYHLK